MKIEWFLSTSSYIAEEYLKVDPLILNGIIEILLIVDEESSGKFLLVGDNYFMIPKVNWPLPTFSV
ncbi:MAG: hypothetical protein A4E74_00576 [Syntrophus sp. PtaB.Bin075]|nr:MAG: hypothetical protein A4E74_00576 [Syntrophus sp. PtaB.Bin075]